jgi:hypothetical protein
MGRNGMLFAVVLSFFWIAGPHGGYTLSSEQQKTLANWLAAHPEFRVSTDADCDCAEEIRRVKAGSEGVWKPIPDYHPYIATGDFNGDGIQDFAVVVIDRSKSSKSFTLLVFNGPITSHQGPAFIAPDLELRGQGIFFGPPRPKPYRLVLGRFESDNSAILVPHGQTYQLQ